MVGGRTLKAAFGCVSFRFCFALFPHTTSTIIQQRSLARSLGRSFGIHARDCSFRLTYRHDQLVSFPSFAVLPVFLLLPRDMSSSDAVLRARLQVFYTKYAPEMIDNIPKVIQDFKLCIMSGANELQLIQHLETK